MFQMMYDVFPLKSVALSMCWSRALLKKINKVNIVDVNIKTCHATYSISRDFNPESHNIINIAKMNKYNLPYLDFK